MTTKTEPTIRCWPGGIGGLALVLALVTLGASPSRATTGTMLISADTTLTEDHFGDIILTADGVTLDCDNYDVVGTGTGIGVNVTGRNDVLVTRCHVRNFGTGFLILDTVDSLFLLNSAMQNTSTNGGFLVDSCPGGVEIEMNRSFQNPVGRGFVVLDSSGVSLRTNGALSNGFRGFDVQFSSDVVLHKNTAQGNGSAGFVAFNCTDLTVRKNISEDSASEGYALLTVSLSTFRQNGALRSGSDGFRLSGGSDNDFRMNRSGENGGTGFRVQADANDYRKNGAFDNGGAGFSVVGSFNFLRQNASFGNGPPADMFDASCPGPLANTWLLNSYGTESCLAID